MVSSRYLVDVAMNCQSLGDDELEDGDLSMRKSHSSYLPHCDLEHRRGRVVEYGIGNLDGGPFVSGERGLSGVDGTQGQVKLWVLVVQNIFH